MAYQVKQGGAWVGVPPVDDSPLPRSKGGQNTYLKPDAGFVRKKDPREKLRDLRESAPKKKKKKKKKPKEQPKSPKTRQRLMVDNVDRGAKVKNYPPVFITDGLYCGDRFHARKEVR